LQVGGTFHDRRNIENIRTARIKTDTALNLPIQIILIATSMPLKPSNISGNF
jgi:hypothetical protein